MNALRTPLSKSLLLLSLLLVPAATAQVTPRREREITRAVSMFLEELHISREPLSDAVAGRALGSYLDGLDPLRVYFLAADHEEFAKRTTDLDDMLRIGKPVDAHVIFDRFKQRVAERVAVIDELLKGEFDFTKDESFLTETKLIKPAKDAAELRDRWRKRLKLDLLNLESDKVEEKDAREQLSKRYHDFLERLGKENSEDVLSRWLNAFTHAYDPHTTYMSPKAYEDFAMGVTLNYHGIGAVLGEEDGYVTIRSLIDGGAAKAHGKLKEGDKIAAVGQGKEGEMVDAEGMRSHDLVKLIRGEEGSFVRLAILPVGGGARRIDLLERRKIELAQNAASSEIFTVPEAEGQDPLRVGVIDLPSFYMDQEGRREGQADPRSSTRDVKRFLEQFQTEDVDIVILDLRTNGGGFLPEAVGVAGLFLDRGPVVQVKVGKRVRVLRDRDQGMAWNGPLVVLTSAASASASEIVAGAIKDWGRGLVVGNARTHGKGTVQTTMDMAEQLEFDEGAGSLGVIKLTLQKFYLPGGVSTQRIGVASDVVLPSWLGVLDEGEAALDNALEGGKIDSTHFKDLGQVDGKVVQELQKRSAERRKGDAYWTDLERRLEAYARQRATHAIPLSRAAFKARNQELEASDEAREAESTGDDEATDKPEKAGEAKPEGEGSSAEKPRVREMAAAPKWMREVLQVTADYHQLLASRSR